MKARALRFVRYDAIEDCLRQGWIGLKPNAVMHHHEYGAELAWLCECPVPGGFRHQYRHRVPVTNKTESAHERAANRA